MDRIMSGDCHDSIPVCHYDMLPLTSDPETSLFQSTNRIEMIYAGQLRHISYLDFPRYFVSAQFRNDFQIL